MSEADDPKGEISKATTVQAFEFWSTIGAEYRERDEMPPLDFVKGRGEEAPEYPSFPVANSDPSEDRGSGIYGILREGKVVYVGQASGKGGFWRRWGRHLNVKIVGNVRLKNAIKKFGPGSFSFVVFEYVERKEEEEREDYTVRLTSVEQTYLDVVRLNTEAFYNSKMLAAPGLEWKSLTDEQREGFRHRGRERFLRLHADIAFAACSAKRLEEKNADPDFAAANVARIKRLNSDPIFVKARLEGLQKKNAEPEFAAALSARMRDMHADPEFAAARDIRLGKMNTDPALIAISTERLRKLNSDPAFAAARSVWGREHMQKLQADPVFAEARDVRLREMNADPVFAAGSAERMRKLNADPTFIAACVESRRKRSADPKFSMVFAEQMRNAHARRREAKGLPPIDCKGILSALVEGLSLNMVAKVFQVSFGTVKRIREKAQAEAVGREDG